MGNFTCPECGGGVVHDEETGEDVCTLCGLVVVEHPVVEQGLEYRVFSASEEQARSRVQKVSALSPRGIGTTFKPSENVRNPMDLTLHHRLKKVNDRSISGDGSVKNIGVALSVIQSLTGKLRMPENISVKAANLYRMILEKNYIRGRSIDDAAIACIYLVCRMQSVPISLPIIINESGRDGDGIKKAYRDIVWKLKVKVPSPGQEDHVGKIADSVGLTRDIARRGEEILQKWGRGVGGKNPRGRAAAALYIACREKNIEYINGNRLTQKFIADKAGITEVTLRNRYKEIDEKLKLGVRDK